MVDFENKLTQSLRTVAEPRLFPLYVNGKVIDYKLDCGDDDDEDTGKKFQLSIELAQTNEIYNFHQAMLSRAGIYLLDFESEAFIWIGKLVPKRI